jgi:hypothetical protein
VRAGRAAPSTTVPTRLGLFDVECSLDVSLDPAPPQDVLRGLLDRAERGCFIGSSLTPKPRYHWRVNGEEIR